MLIGSRPPGLASNVLWSVSRADVGAHAREQRRHGFITDTKHQPSAARLHEARLQEMVNDEHELPLFAVPAKPALQHRDDLVISRRQEVRGAAGGIRHEWRGSRYGGR